MLSISKVSELCQRFRNGEVSVVRMDRSDEDGLAVFTLGGVVWNDGWTAVAQFHVSVDGDMLKAGSVGREEQFVIRNRLKTLLDERLELPEDPEQTDERYYAFTPVRLAVFDAVFARLLMGRPVLDRQ